MKIQVDVVSITLEDRYVYTSNADEYMRKVASYTPFDFITLKDLTPTNDGKYSGYLVEEDSLLLNKDQMIELVLANIKFKVNSVIKVPFNLTQDLINMQDKAALSLSAPPVHSEYNNKCEVHMPGQALSLYNEVLLQENSCTDVLSDFLKDGWRIIAACPQPDQRRPDYILGRYNPELKL